MLFATRLRLLRYLMLLLPGLAFVGLGSGCQSSRPAFSFQPMPHPVAVVDVPAPTTLTDSPTMLTDSASPAATVAPASKPGAPVRKSHKLRPAAKLGMAMHSVVAMPQLARQLRSVHRRALLSRPHGTADSGFGLLVLGVLGLLALVVGIVGLILSGGSLGWIIVVGAAALVVLIAYIDPHGR